MNTHEDHKRPGQKTPRVSFLLAIAGLSLVVAGADLLVHSASRGLAWVLLVIGAGLLVCAVLLAAGRLS